MSAEHPARRLRARLQPRDGVRRLLTVPGCWDGLSALLIEQAGFEAAFVTGGGVSFGRLGRPDIGLTAAGEMADTVGLIRDRINLPLIVDADTGFGGALNVIQTVRRFERAGASALQIEDQTFPKRCGHMSGKSVVPTAEMVGKLQAALDARDEALIIARTDALGVEGLDAALDRAEAYLGTGVDLLFVEGPRTLEETAAVARRFGGRVPLVHNLVEGGVTATRDGGELEAMGFAVALHPLVLMHGFVKAAPRWLALLKAERSTVALEPELIALQQLNAVAGAPELVDLGARYAGACA